MKIKIKKLINKLFNKILNLQHKKEIPSTNFSFLSSKEPAYSPSYIIEGVDLFCPRIHIFFEKTNFSIYYLKLYAFLVENYPNSRLTRWFIKNTKLGTLRVLSHSGKILMVRTFGLFKNHLFHVESFYLNRAGVSFDYLSAISVSLTLCFCRKKQKDFSELILPASVMFDTIGFTPLNVYDSWDISLWDIGTDFCFYP